jgi:plasmid stabilization system protein ParE
MSSALVSKRAQRDLERIKEYIAKADPEAAETVRSAILDIADLLAQTVEAGSPIINAPERFKDVRWFVVPRFRNYLIFYRP